ncbi:unnamed protein product [Arctia plantaginis]|uniref:Major facilitator superfamily (MFS) profile domain-containing protein n=1 Tax=Arctia plantaginis TaxID=874455 RepID=A0A8S1AEC0_ARCPL|nr:unnamed protein product [Arctia plantaginis]
MRTSHACKPFGIIMIFITCESLSGTPFVTFWTIELLLALKSSFDVYTGNFFIAITRFLFCGVASVLLLRTPRKTMALISAGGVSVTCLSLAVFLNIEEEPSVFPQIFLMIYTAFASLGFYILPFLFMSELYPLQIRGTLTGISISIINVQKFIIAKCFPSLKDNFGIPNIMILSSVSSFICFVFLYIFLPETKGLTLREIEEHFNNHNSRRDSQRQLSSLHATFSNSQGRKRLGDVVRNFGRKSKDDKEFIQIYDSTSIISRESKESATLLTDGKQFRSITSIEKAELKQLQDGVANRTINIQTEANNAGSNVEASANLFDKTKKDENESDTSTGGPSTSKKA